MSYSSRLRLLVNSRPCKVHTIEITWTLHHVCMCTRYCLCTVRPRHNCQLMYTTCHGIDRYIQFGRLHTKHKNTFIPLFDNSDTGIKCIHVYIICYSYSESELLWLLPEKQFASIVMSCIICKLQIRFVKVN